MKLRLHHPLMLLMLVVVCALLIAPHAAAITLAAQTNCPDALPSRLVVGQKARVLPGSSNNVRDIAARSGNKVGEIPAEAEFKVLAGPTCADGLAWWQVDYEGLIGWTVEAVGTDYALEPILPPPPQALTVEGVSVTLDALVGSNLTGATHDGILTFSFEGLPDGQTAEFFIAPSAARLAAEITALQQVLAENPARQSPIPVIGAINPAGQEAYLTFASGTAIRFVSLGLNADNMPQAHYVAYGLSSDTRYLIVLSYPLQYLPGLPEFVTSAEPETDQYKQDFAAYGQQITPLLNAAAPTDFVPSPEVLDAFVSSIQIAPNVLETEIADAEATMTARCGNFDAALIVGKLGLQALTTDSIRIRDAAGGNAISGQNVFPGEWVEVLEGPVCVNEINWWRVRSVPNPTFEGWVPGQSDVKLFFTSIIRTATPTLTPTPTITLTPSITPTRGPTNTPRPTATQITSICQVTMLQQNRLRVEPDPTSSENGYLDANVTVYAVGQFKQAGEDFPWWKLASDTPVSVVNGKSIVQQGVYWLRADFVKEEGDCDSLPIIETVRSLLNVEITPCGDGFAMLWYLSCQTKPSTLP